MPRLFVAVEIPDAPRRAVAAALAPWRGDRSVGWSRPETWHLTHLTVGRARGDARALLAAIGTLPALGDFVADRVVLFRSDLAPDGARHTPLATFDLAGSSVGAQIPSG